MNRVLADVTSRVQPYIDESKEIPEGQETQVAELWRFITTVQVANLFTDEKYEEVLKSLDTEFWANLQDDRELNRKLFGYLSASAYKVAVKNARDKQLKTDPNLMVELWPKYEHTITVYRQLVERWPELGDGFNNNRRQISALLNIVKSQAGWFQQNVDAKTAGFESFEADQFSKMQKLPN